MYIFSTQFYPFVYSSVQKKYQVKFWLNYTHQLKFLESQTAILTTPLREECHRFSHNSQIQFNFIRYFIIVILIDLSFSPLASLTLNSLTALFCMKMSAICLYTSEILSRNSLNDLIYIGGGSEFISPINVDKAAWPSLVSRLESK